MFVMNSMRFIFLLSDELHFCFDELDLWHSTIFVCYVSSLFCAFLPDCLLGLSMSFVEFLGYDKIVIILYNWTNLICYNEHQQ
jgi:hypothetical protein